MTINKIAHIADIHLRKSPNRNVEYSEVFENLFKSLRIENPDRIVIVGDLVHDYLDLQGEQLILAKSLLDSLAKIAPVRVTRGNHDCRKKSIKRVDSIEALVKVLNNPNIVYYSKTGFYQDNNITWAVWHHGEQNNNPWKSKEAKTIKSVKDNTIIDLYHDPIGGCIAMNGFEMTSKALTKVSEFQGDFSFLGDIHKMQYLNKSATIAYCGSLIAQDINEGDDNFHGYLLWDIASKKTREISIPNNYSFKNVPISAFTDFDDLDFEIDNPTDFMKIRFVWNTLPHTRNKDNERKLKEHVIKKYGNQIVYNKNNFIENNKITVKDSTNLLNVTDKSVQHEIFREYLDKIGLDSKTIDEIIALDDEIIKLIEVEEASNSEWNIIKFGAENFMSYEKFDIDWRDMEGLFQITGDNAAGKTTILKAISYILYNKTLETESRVEFGDSRYVNNKNGAKYTSAYMVLESGGEYYGIQRRTDLKFSKDGALNGAPTTLNYFLLSNPDDEMNKNSSLENLEADLRAKTQKKISRIVGTYDNFMRVVMTTSDTLNNILSNNMATFIDSLLFDSGLDIFDKKLNGLKLYQNNKSQQTRIVCNVEKVNADNVRLKTEINVCEDNIKHINDTVLPELLGRIKTGQTYIETLIKKLYTIDDEIYNLNVEETTKGINIHQKNITEISNRLEILNSSISLLKETYDEEKLNNLLQKKDEHKTKEYELNLKIREHYQEIRDIEHNIEIWNGKVFNLKKEGLNKKDEIQRISNSKICSNCNQPLLPEHQEHINKNIKSIEILMFGIGDEIRNIGDVEIPKCQEEINVINLKIKAIKDEISEMTDNMELVLEEIGTLNNEKNDVNKRKLLQLEADNIPIKIKNEELMISILNQKIISYNNSLLQIEENKKIEKGITAAKAKVQLLYNEEREQNEIVYTYKSDIGEKSKTIKDNETLVTLFKEQEHRDDVIAQYKACVHRDGIPRQMLATFIIPKINVILESILSITQFRVWLDENDLRPKLAYNDMPSAIIDCISSSGKERTFSSVPLKFALNQINIKSKPLMFLLDEVMGKLDDNSVEEFIEILHIIAKSMSKVLIIEHVREINPDYLIDVKINENRISSLTID